MINHEVLGEGYYFQDKNKKITFVDKKYKNFVKKLNKRGYTELTTEQLDVCLCDFIKRFVESLKNTSIEYENDTIDNILYLWYKGGFCHYKTFTNGILYSATISGKIKVSTCNNVVDKYPTIQKVCGYGFESEKIYDADLEKLYEMYGDKSANN